MFSVLRNGTLLTVLLGLALVACAIATGFIAGRYLNAFWDGLLGWFRRW